MPRVINLVGKQIGSEELPCVHSFAIEDPNHILIDMTLHTAEKDKYVVIVNNALHFGHNYQVTLPNPSLQVSVVILLRKAITDAYEADDPTRYIDIDNIVKAVVDDANIPVDEEIKKEVEAVAMSEEQPQA